MQEAQEEVRMAPESPVRFRRPLLVVHLFGFDRIENWVQSLEFHSGVGGGALPVDPYPLSVAVALPGGDFALPGGEVREAPVATLTSSHPQCDLRHVQPTAGLGGRVSLQPSDPPPRLLRRKGLIQR